MVRGSALYDDSCVEFDLSAAYTHDGIRRLSGLIYVRVDCGLPATYSDRLIAPHRSMPEARSMSSDTAVDRFRSHTVCASRAHSAIRGSTIVACRNDTRGG